MERREYSSTRSTYHRASSPSEVERDVAGGRNTHELKPGSARSRKQGCVHTRNFDQGLYQSSKCA
jgi:hypothetical protein